MSKYIGIDYGHKKIGLSVTDDDKVFAFPLCQNSDRQKQRITQLIIIKMRPMLCPAHS